MLVHLVMNSGKSDLNMNDTYAARSKRPIGFGDDDCIWFSGESDWPAVARWDAMLNGHHFYDPCSDGSPVGPFDIRPAQFLRHALEHAPAMPGATVSAFSDWVYSLYAKPSDPLAMEFGLKIEKQIFKERSKIVACPDFTFPAKRNWKLIHNGLHLHEHEEVQIPIHHIDSLVVGGEPLRASPDLIYVHDATGSVVVVEIKFSWAKIPDNLWPNVWAQLWAYSKLPMLQRYPQITLVGEVWVDQSEMRRSILPGLEQLVYLRKTVKRDPKNPSFEKFFSTLFDIYRGQFHQ